MSYTMYTPLNVWLDPASVTDVVAYIQTYLRDNPIYSEAEIEEQIHDYLIAHPELIGGVQSVNGKTGTVVLSASDINTENNVTIESVLASLSSQISTIAANVATNTANITSLTGRVSTAETDLSNLKSNFDGAFNGTVANIPLSHLNVYQNGAYMDGYGSIVSASAHKLLEISSIGIKSLTINTSQINSSTAAAVLKNSNDQVLKYWVLNASTILIDLSDYVDEQNTLYINWLNANTDPTSYYNSVYVEYQTVSDIVEKNTSVLSGVEAYRQLNNALIPININDLTVVGNGYINANGTIGTGSMHRYLSMPAEGLRCLKYTTLQQTNLMFVVIKDSQGNVVFNSAIGSVGVHECYFDSMPSGSIAYFNQFSYATVPNEYVNETFYAINYPNVINANREYVLNLLEAHRVNKPFVFNSKSAEFCGDSITRGYINGSSTTENGYPKLFSDAVGLSFTNKGVGGATLSVVEDNPSIQTQVQSINANADYVFIAGGVNDWQLGVSLSDFKSAVENICDWLNSNYTGQVIWITPINQAGWETTHQLNTVAELQDYRDIITQVVTVKTTGNMSIVQGNLFGFPTIYGSADLKNSMFGDLLHPSEHGYVIYAQALRSALC